MGRIEKIKRGLILEANKRLLGEQAGATLSDEIHDDIYNKVEKEYRIRERTKKIPYINYLNTKYEEIGDTIIELYLDNLKIAEEIFNEELDDLTVSKNMFFKKNYEDKISFFCKTTESIKKKIERNLLDSSNKVLDIFHVLEKINEDTDTGVVPYVDDEEVTDEDFEDTGVVPYVDDEEVTDEYDDFEEVTDEYDDFEEVGDEDFEDTGVVPYVDDEEVTDEDFEDTGVVPYVDDEEVTDDEYDDFEEVGDATDDLGELVKVSYDEEIVDDYKKRLNTTLMAIKKEIKNNLNELPDHVKLKLLDCWGDMLTPIFEKNGAMENLDRYIKMRGDEVNQKIDQLIDYHESATKFDNQTGEVDNPIYEKQLDKIIKLLNFRKDERLNTYIKDLIKEY
jgi:hypothetical protein